MLYFRSGSWKSYAMTRRYATSVLLLIVGIIFSGRPASAFSWNLLLVQEFPFEFVSTGTFEDGSTYQFVGYQFNNVQQLNGPAVLLREGDDFNASVFLSGTSWTFPQGTTSASVDLNFNANTGTAFLERGSWDGKMSLYLGSTLLVESQAYGIAFNKGATSDDLQVSSGFPQSGFPIEIPAGMTFDTVIFEGKYSGQPASVRFADVLTSFNFYSIAVPEPSTYALALASLACGGYLVRRRRKRA